MNDQALLKIKQYCAYQERCLSEVREKLYSFGLSKKEAEEIIPQLIAENYLSEERFAVQFTSGKFRIKKWGRVKIKYALKQKQVSDHFIQRALKQIDEYDYKKTLNKLAEQKLKTLGSVENIFSKKRKLYDYLLQKGYEGALVKEMTETIAKEG